MQVFEDHIQFSIDYLTSKAALESLAADPYWPKWNSPWWHITLLYEMGLTSRIPQTVIKAFLDAFRNQYLEFFPFTEADVPAGKDPIRNVACHCALATVFKIAAACNLNPDEELPWARPWFLKYQLPDGGFNCDEAAYLKSEPKSSMVSTLPVLEALLEGTKRSFSQAEIFCLEAGARYLLEHRFFRKKAPPMDIINPGWVNLCFPRFYEYDFLRGLSFLCRLEEKTAWKMPTEQAEEVVGLLKQVTDPKSRYPIIGRQAWAGAKTRFRGPDGSWMKGKSANSFPLLELVGFPGTPCPFLKPDFDAVRRHFS